MNALTLIPGSLTLAQLRQVWQQPLQLTLDESAHQAINDSVACVEAIVAEGRTAYGINTGFGLLAQTRIATHDLENLQRSLVLSHAAGVGEPLDDNIVRLMMVLKINSLARGFSGITPERDSGSDRAGQCRGLSVDPGQGFGRRVRRPGSAGAHVPDPARRG